jgi:hypothetical protein
LLQEEEVVVPLTTPPELVAVARVDFSSSRCLWLLGAQKRFKLEQEERLVQLLKAQVPTDRIQFLHP